MKIHLIAIGGAVMHNFALALKNSGHIVTGSDDDIQSPSRERLQNAGLFPAELGWHPELITPDLDLIILGMHAKKDNPELLRAQELGLEIKSFPEYLGEVYKDKRKIVVAGSHGKTTTTSMIMHMLKNLHVDYDYMVGSNIEGFDTMVSFTDAPIAVIEGDEYLSSPLDSSSKFLHYSPDIAIITGIAWDHINVFPTFDSYLETFASFIRSINQDGYLIYYKNDKVLADLVKQHAVGINLIPYEALEFETKDGKIFIKDQHGSEAEIEIFGKHNLENLHAAILACTLVGCDRSEVIKAIKGFTGAGRRLEKIREQSGFVSFLDFAHAPSKLKSTVDAVRQRYPDHNLIAIYELHTFSSLNENFLKEYRDTMLPADSRIVFYNEHTFKLKNMPVLEKQLVIESFGDPGLQIYTQSEELKDFILSGKLENSVLLWMTSGTFGGMDIRVFTNSLILSDK